MEGSLPARRPRTREGRSFLSGGAQQPISHLTCLCHSSNPVQQLFQAGVVGHRLPGVDQHGTEGREKPGTLRVHDEALNSCKDAARPPTTLNHCTGYRTSAWVARDPRSRYPSVGGDPKASDHEAGKQPNQPRVPCKCPGLPQVPGEGDWQSRCKSERPFPDLQRLTRACKCPRA